jgi:hypothetical protein
MRFSCKFKQRYKLKGLAPGPAAEILGCIIGYTKYRSLRSSIKAAEVIFGQ